MRRGNRQTCRRGGVVRLRLLAALALGFGLARLAGLPHVAADPPAKPGAAAEPGGTAEGPEQSAYSQRVVAYIYGTEPITREDLGEFLIARYGAEKIQLLVNKRIIERACRKRGVDVTPQEIAAALEQDLNDLGGVSKKDFVNVVLKNYGKTLYEWEQDVIKPRLLLGKLCRDRIKVTEEDLKKMFEHLYGEKVRCRLIMWPPGQERIAQQKYAEIRESEENFARAARTQADATLASAGGQIAPIGRHSYGKDNLMEKEAFALRPGELSRLISTPQGTIVLKCDGRVPPDTTKDFEKEKPELEKEIINRKIQMEIPKLFAELQKEANPQLFLKPAAMTANELEENVRKELQPAGGMK